MERITDRTLFESLECWHNQHGRRKKCKSIKPQVVDHINARGKLCHLGINHT